MAQQNFPIQTFQGFLSTVPLHSDNNRILDCGHHVSETNSTCRPSHCLAFSPFRLLYVALSNGVLKIYQLLTLTA